ncbi:MAG: transcriptional regulator with domain and aminotransferase domain [Firmicutes bacterium]|nr:transcriptional regulator with domain and aminotransferase domain [Bacillota bacterium]
MMNKNRTHPQTSSDVNLKNTFKYNFQYGKLNAKSFPLRLWRKISNQCLSSLNVNNMMSYNESQGELGLRVEIMKYLNISRGVSCQPEQIIICSGTQSCLTLLCQLFRSHSTNVAIEDPGYDGARDVFINSGYNVIPISLENGSIDVGELENSLAKIIYITPSHQFPTGAVMPIHKRLKVLNWAIKNKAIIIEDDYDSELRYNTKPIPSIHCIESQENVLYIGTFSKSLAPALRLSYMVLPQSWLEKYRNLFAKYNSTVPFHQQKILQQFMSLGYWDSHLRKSCLSYKKKHDTLVGTINQVMGDKVTIHGKNAGLHILLEFNNGLYEKELIEKANNHGVLVYPVSRYWMRLERYSNNMILLGFSELNENEIVEGINILNHAWFGN